MNKHKTWYIIDDDLVKIRKIIESIRYSFPGDYIYWYYPEKIISKGFEELLKHFKVERSSSFTKPSELLTLLNSNKNDGIILSEISIPGIINENHETGIKNALSEFLKDVPNSMLCLTTTRKNLVREKKWFSPSLYNRIYIDNSDFEKKYDIQGLIINLENKWLELFRKNPIKIFLDKMYQLFSAQQNPEDTNHAHNWTGQYPFPPPQLDYLTEFMDIKTEEYIANFKLKTKDNPTGECLKVMGTRDKQHLPLLGVLFIAWSAYRRSCVSKQTVNNQFINLLVKLNQDYILPEKRETAGEFARFKNLLPKKNYLEYCDTLNSLYFMFTALFHHNGKDRLIRIKKTASSIVFTIKADHPAVLISHLNESLNHLVENSRLLKEHDSIVNSRIIDFFIRFHLNSSESLNYKSHNNIHTFGNENSFALFKRHENILEIQFKLLTDD